MTEDRSTPIFQETYPGDSDPDMSERKDRQNIDKLISSEVVVRHPEFARKVSWLIHKLEQRNKGKEFDDREIIGTLTEEIRPFSMAGKELELLDEEDLFEGYVREKDIDEYQKKLRQAIEDLKKFIGEEEYIKYEQELRNIILQDSNGEGNNQLVKRRKIYTAWERNGRFSRRVTSARIPGNSEDTEFVKKNWKAFCSSFWRNQQLLEITGSRMQDRFRQRRDLVSRLQQYHQDIEPALIKLSERHPLDAGLEGQQDMTIQELGNRADQLRCSGAWFATLACSEYNQPRAVAINDLYLKFAQRLNPGQEIPLYDDRIRESVKTVYSILPQIPDRTFYNILGTARGYGTFHWINTQTNPLVNGESAPSTFGIIDEENQAQTNPISSQSKDSGEVSKIGAVITKLPGKFFKKSSELKHRPTDKELRYQLANKIYKEAREYLQNNQEQQIVIVEPGGGNAEFSSILAEKFADDPDTQGRVTILIHEISTGMIDEGRDRVATLNQRRKDAKLEPVNIQFLAGSASIELDIPINNVYRHKSMIDLNHLLQAGNTEKAKLLIKEHEEPRLDFIDRMTKLASDPQLKKKILHHGSKIVDFEVTEQEFMNFSNRKQDIGEHQKVTSSDWNQILKIRDEALQTFFSEEISLSDDQNDTANPREQIKDLATSSEQKLMQRFHLSVEQAGQLIESVSGRVMWGGVSTWALGAIEQSKASTLTDRLQHKRFEDYVDIVKGIDYSDYDGELAWFVMELKHKFTTAQDLELEKKCFQFFKGEDVQLSPDELQVAITIRDYILAPNLVRQMTRSLVRNLSSEGNLYLLDFDCEVPQAADQWLTSENDMKIAARVRNAQENIVLSKLMQLQTGLKQIFMLWGGEASAKGQGHAGGQVLEAIKACEELYQVNGINSEQISEKVNLKVGASSFARFPLPLSKVQEWIEGLREEQGNIFIADIPGYVWEHCRLTGIKTTEEAVFKLGFKPKE